MIIFLPGSAFRKRVWGSCLGQGNVSVRQRLSRIHLPISRNLQAQQRNRSKLSHLERETVNEKTGGLQGIENVSLAEPHKP